MFPYGISPEKFLGVSLINRPRKLMLLYSNITFNPSASLSKLLKSSFLCYKSLERNYFTSLVSTCPLSQKLCPKKFLRNKQLGYCFVITGFGKLYIQDLERLHMECLEISLEVTPGYQRLAV